MQKRAIVLEGYVNAVGRDSRILRARDGTNFIEQIVPGAFKRALERASDITIDLNHNRRLGSTSEGNLEVYEDSIGLYARSMVCDEEILTLAYEEAFTGWSFEFNPVMYRKEKSEIDGVERWYLEDLRLLSVSILTVTPAYIATEIDYRDETAEMRFIRSADGNIQKTFIFNASLENLKRRLTLLKLKG